LDDDDENDHLETFEVWNLAITVMEDLIRFIVERTKSSVWLGEVLCIY
jgi:hypothetical protein